MITATLQMEKLRPTRANKVLEFKDDALEAPVMSVMLSCAIQTGNSFVFPKRPVCIYFMDTEFWN